LPFTKIFLNEKKNIFKTKKICLSLSPSIQPFFFNFALPQKMMLSCRVKGNFIPLAALWLEKYYEIRARKKCQPKAL
jgi:hypothetical protein